MNSIAKDKIKHLRFGFYTERLSILQILFLSTLMISESFLLYAKFTTISLSSFKVFDSMIFVLIGWAPLVFGFANYFRNIYFTILWVLMCVAWINLKDDFVTSILPLFIVAYLISARFIFKYIFNYEPIFMLVGRNIHHHYNKLENRDSNKRDFIFSMLTFIAGSILLITLPTI